MRPASQLGSEDKSEEYQTVARDYRGVAQSQAPPIHEESLAPFLTLSLSFPALCRERLLRESTLYWPTSSSLSTVALRKWVFLKPRSPKDLGEICLARPAAFSQARSTTPQAAKKKKKAKKGGQTKAVNAGLEGFMAGIYLTSSEPIEEGRTICITLLLDSPHGCTSELQALRGRLPPPLKYHAASASNGLDGEA